MHGKYYCITVKIEIFFTLYVDDSDFIKNVLHNITKHNFLQQYSKICLFTNKLLALNCSFLSGKRNPPFELFLYGSDLIANFAF